MRQAIFAGLLGLPMLAQAQPAAPSLDDRMSALEQKLDALQGAPAPSNIGSFNPAIGMALDSVFHEENAHSGFQFRAAELNLEAPADPFLKVYAIITGSNGGVDVEEAAAETTSLPYNLKFKAGRFFASFGRQAHFHDHELNVVDRPLSLDSFIGGETRADGAEAEYLFPVPFYLRGTVGMYNKVGTNNTRLDIGGTPAGQLLRPLKEDTYLGRLATYADLNDDHSVELGVDALYTPADASGTSGTWRVLKGIDLTYRYYPVKGGLYRGVLWGTEILENDELRPVPGLRKKAWSGYTFVETKLGVKVRPGVLMDLSQDLDSPGHVTRTYAGYVTYNWDEFNRLRLQYSHQSRNAGRASSDIVALQWSAVIGWHVHGFRDR